MKQDRIARVIALFKQASTWNDDGPYEISAFGDTMSFDTLEKAEKAVRSCGGDLADTRLFERGSRIVDERGHAVGRVKDAATQSSKK